VTFQHDPDFQHQPGAFDQQRCRLYCYSPEMIERYHTHAPIRALSVQIGMNETEPPAVPGADLVWVGRVDEQKSPHIAVIAAGLLGRRIHIVGPIFDSDYYQRHAKLFASDHVHIAGELGGPAKTAAFARASTCVYTCGRSYVEAGVATLGESLRAGTPVAALAWRNGTCAEVGLCDSTGAVAVVDPSSSDEHAAHALAQAIATTDPMDALAVQAIGLERFDPAMHFEILATRP
jgi:glycosyltransferase involved in cell wall biosynthesis